MPERVQPGAEVSKDEYEAFKAWVADHHGSVRGNLGRELENAMRQYRTDDRPRDAIARIEDDMATVKAIVADELADGGTHLSDVVGSAHAPADSTDTTAADRRDGSDGRDDPTSSGPAPGTEAAKPASNQPRGAKVDWMVDRYTHQLTAVVTTHSDVVSNVVDWYGFREALAEDYADDVLDALDAEPVVMPAGHTLWGLTDDATANLQERAERGRNAAADAELAEQNAGDAVFDGDA